MQACSCPLGLPLVPCHRCLSPLRLQRGVCERRRPSAAAPAQYGRLRRATAATKGDQQGPWTVAEEQPEAARGGGQGPLARLLQIPQLPQLQGSPAQPDNGSGDAAGQPAVPAMEPVSEVFENQRGYGVVGWKAPVSILDAPEFSDAAGAAVALPARPSDDPSRWELVVGGATDDEGWQYATVRLYRLVTAAAAHPHPHPRAWAPPPTPHPSPPALRTPTSSAMHNKHALCHTPCAAPAGVQAFGVQEAGRALLGALRRHGAAPPVAPSPRSRRGGPRRGRAAASRGRGRCGGSGSGNSSHGGGSGGSAGQRRGQRGRGGRRCGVRGGCAGYPGGGGEEEGGEGVYKHGSGCAEVGRGGPAAGAGLARRTAPAAGRRRGPAGCTRHCGTQRLPRVHPPLPPACRRRPIWTLLPWDPAALFLLYQKHQRVYQELQVCVGVGVWVWVEEGGGLLAAGQLAGRLLLAASRGPRPHRRPVPPSTAQYRPPAAGPGLRAPPVHR